MTAQEAARLGFFPFIVLVLSGFALLAVVVAAVVRGAADEKEWDRGRLPALLHFVIVRIPVQLWRFALYAWYGSSYFCWDSDCWERAWHHCHATRKIGNGRMCEYHCKNASYHDARRTGCGHPSGRVVDLRPSNRLPTARA
jgi:hypothetical protein